ncbi:NAD(P)H-binding protein [Methanobrevibacter sp.]|uniref:NAD(P)H-binding protein n=1 Tax=Methanobrevibacter sp. TaxID=66852 RepID=UPI003869CB0F
MNIAIIGATGNFGIPFTAKLLSIPDYQLTLISKSAGNIYEDSHRITARSLDATNRKELKSLLENQDIVYCAVSGEDQSVIARNIVELNVKRLIYMTVVGIYNELPKDNGGEYNLENEKEQIPNRNAVDIIEESDLDYTILRSGYIIYENDDECVITKKGQEARGYVSTYKSIEKIALEIIENPELYSRESISVTRDMS